MKLMEYLDHAQSPYHVVEHLSGILKEAGFQSVSRDDISGLTEEGSYYVNAFDTTLIAFRLTKGAKGFHIASAHTDYPCFKLKPLPDLAGSTGNCFRVNVEPYGGMLKRTWFDRPLGIAGAIYSKGSDSLHPVKTLYQSKSPAFLIPGLAPHMDREIEKKDISVQKELLPIYSLASGQSSSHVMDHICRGIGLEADDVLSFDLNLFLWQKASTAGANQEFIMSQGLDNIASVSALAEAIISEKARDYIPIACFFHNEEIGSMTKQGADSRLLPDLLVKIKGLESGSRVTSGESMILSADGAHAVHPNYPEKSDPTSGVEMGKGMVIKTSAAQRYATDARMTAIIRSVCQEQNIAIQVQANRSGAPGGSTLGPMLSSHIPYMAADVGIPMLSMHSSYETVCRSDYQEFEKFIKWML